jgi:riboflavin biosynthesis pyrimidine reductase
MMRRLFPSPEPLAGDEDLESAYLLPPQRHVRADFVTSVDGMVEIDGRSGPLAGPADRAVFLAMRAATDAVLVGAGTVRQEKYGAVRLDDAVQARRRARDQAPLPALAVVTNRGDLDARTPIFSGSERPILLTTAAATEARPDLAAIAEVVLCGDQYVDIVLALSQLRDRGLVRVLCEGGPTLLRSLVGAHLLDELCLTTSPRLAGTGHRGLLGDQPLPGVVSLRLTDVLEGDGMLFSRYCCVEAE